VRITATKKLRFGRGDAFWLYKSANQTLAIAARIEQLLEAKNKNNTATVEDEEKQKEAEAEKLLQQIRKEQIKRKKVSKKDEEK
jgi:hypothetical protein